MSLLSGIALAVMGLSLAAVLVYWLVVSWRRVMHDDGPLPLFRMIKRRPLSPAGHETLANAAIMAPAVRRCVYCSSMEQCRAWLALGKPSDRPANCPNSDLFERLN